MTANRNPRANDVPYHVSRISCTAFAVLFLAGVAEGALAYSSRSPVTERHVPGTNAITVHVVLALIATAVVIGVQAWRWRTSQRGHSPWAAPFSSRALAAVRRTLLADRGLSLPGLVRAVVTVPLMLAMAYVPVRLGAQITGGLDPNSTVNAWGGPSYLGALLAHWLDCAAIFYAAAFLLSRVLLAAAARRTDHPAPREAASRAR